MIAQHSHGTRVMRSFTITFFEDTTMAYKKQNVTVNGVHIPETTVDINEAKKLLGWREAEDGEVGFPYTGPDGKGRFVLTNNKANRPFSLQRADQYKQLLLTGQWAGQRNSPSKTLNGEPIIIDADGNVVSFAHRGVGLILAELERQRLYALRDGASSPAGRKLKEFGLNGPISMKALLVEGVDPNSADTVDTGKSRTLGDVLFRRHEFGDEQVPASLETRLSNSLAIAARLVWLRLQGLQVSKGPKGEIPDLIAYVERHPLLLDAVRHVHEVDGGGGKEGKRISSYISLGYAAGLMYLAAFSEVKRQSYEDGSLDLSRKPKRWNKAAEFWTLFARNLHAEENSIRALHVALERNRVNKKSKYSRDALCTLVTRAFLTFAGETEDWTTVRSLTKGLASKDSNVLRFGGLDLDRATLKKTGVIEDDVAIIRTPLGLLESWRYAVGRRLRIRPLERDDSELHRRRQGGTRSGRGEPVRRLQGRVAQQEEAQSVERACISGNTRASVTGRSGHPVQGLIKNAVPELPLGDETWNLGNQPAKPIKILNRNQRRRLTSFT